MIDWKAQLARADYLVICGDKKFPDYYARLATKMKKYQQWKSLTKDAPWLVMVVKEQEEILDGMNIKGVASILAPHVNVIINIQTPGPTGRRLRAYYAENGRYRDMHIQPSETDYPNYINVNMFRQDIDIPYLLEAK